MNDIKATSSQPRRRSVGRILLVIAGALLVLVIALYFVGTSAAFFKGVILPRVGAALNADVTVSDAAISPFSSVTLRDLKVQPRGGEPVFTAREVRARYSLLSILGGKIVVTEATIESPVISVIENADGTSNLDAFRPTPAKAKKTAAPPAAKSTPPQVDVKLVALNNATVRLVKHHKDGARDVTEITGLNFSARDLKNGSSGKIELDATLALDKAAQPSAPAGSFRAKVGGSFTFDLLADLQPASVKGNTTFTVEQAAGALAELAALGARLDCEVTPTELKQVALRFTKAGAALGEVRVSGPFALAKQEGKLKAEILALDRQVLNLAAAGSGMDFGTTTINSSTEIELTKGGQEISLAGFLEVARFQVTRLGQTSPTLDLRSDYNVLVDNTAQSASLKTLNLVGKQNQHPLLQAGLDKPLTIAWGKTSGAVGDATLNLAVTGLNLADWKAFAGTASPAGTFNAKLKLVSTSGGKQLALDLDSRVDKFSAKFGSNQVSQADLQLQAHASAVDLKQFKLADYRLEIAPQGQPALVVSGSGTFDRATQDADLQMAVQAKLAPLLALQPQPEANVMAGALDAKLKLVSHSGGKQLALELDSRVEKFSAKFGSNQVSQADLQLQAHVQAADLKQFKLADYRLEIAHQGQPALVMSGSGTFDRATQDADLQVAVQATLARLLALLPQPEANVTAGALDFKGHVVSKDKSQTVTGQLALTDFTGRYGNFRFKNYGAALDFDAGMKESAIEIRKAAGDLREGQNAGGHFEASGSFETVKKSGQIAVKLTDFNPNGLRPFLESALGDKKLVSVALNTTAAVNLAANGDAAIKTDLQITNLVVNDPTGALPATPLEARVQLDATVAKQLTQIRQGQLTLTPTDRAKNELNLTGSVDASKSNAISGTLKLAAESLDVTRYYDLFAGKTKPAASPTATKPAPAPETAPANPDQEPPAMTLPFQNFTFDLNISRFYLREVAITNLLSTARIDGGHVVLKPCSLTLNGAPVSATVDLDLGVPGYKYDVAFDVKVVPLAPLVNSFMPDRKGQMAGTTTASAQLKGAGITGASLQKNLTGQFDFAATNLNLAVANVRSPLLKTVINVIVSIPDLIKNPTAALGNLLSGLTGSGAAKSSWTDALTASPIDVILARGTAGGGRVQLQQTEVRGAAFQAQAAGDLTLAPILTNSTIQIPVSVALGRSLAAQAGLVSASTPTNAAYVSLPDFLKMKGTLGNPKAEIDKLALVALAAKAGGGIAGQIGGTSGDKVGSALNALGGLLGGGKSAPAAGTQTNSTVTNAAPAPNLLDLFKKPKKK